MRVLLVLCSLTVAVWGQGSTSTVLDYLTSRRHTTFVNLIDQAGLTDTLKGAGPFTIFAPTESKLRSLPTGDTAKLAAILKYHIASGAYKRADFYNERLLDSLHTNAKIRMNHYYSVGKYTAEGQQVTSFDHQASNGVVHYISDVMTPPTGTVLDILNTDANFTTLLKAVQQARLDTFFQDQNPITFFAPTNKAFADLGSGTVQGLFNNPTLLASVLQYHAIPGSLYKAGYHASNLHTFEEDDKIRLHTFLFFGYEVDGGSITGNELSATNGVIHKIEKVLIPKSLAAQVQAVAATTGVPVSTTVTFPISTGSSITFPVSTVGPLMFDSPA